MRYCTPARTHTIIIIINRNLPQDEISIMLEFFFSPLSNPLEDILYQRDTS